MTKITDYMPQMPREFNDYNGLRYCVDGLVDDYAELEVCMTWAKDKGVDYCPCDEREEVYDNLSEAEIENHRNEFWVVYGETLDKLGKDLMNPDSDYRLLDSSGDDEE